MSSSTFTPSLSAALTDPPVIEVPSQPEIRSRAGWWKGLSRGLLSLTDQGVVSGTSFATSVIIGRLCSREDLGVYALALSAVMVIRGIEGELVSTPYIIFCHRHSGSARAAFAGSTLAHFLLLTLLGVVGLVGLASLISLGVGPRALEPIAWVLVGAAPLLLLREYIRQLCLAHLHMVTVVLLDSFVSVLQLGCLAALGYLGALTVGRAYVVMGLACAVPCLAWFLLGQPALRLVASQWLSDWKHNWAFSRWTLSSFLIGSTTPYLMPWVVALIHGEQATGVLAACQTLVNLAGTYVTGVTHVLTPQAARAFADGGFQALRQVLRRTAVLFGVTLGLFCLAVLCAGDLPAILVYGDRYTQVGMVLTVLALNTLTNSLGITAGNGLWVLERPWANLRADVWAFLGTFSGAIFFVPRFGVLGAALALLTGTSVGVLIRCLTLFRLMRELQGRQVSLTQGEAA